MFEIYFYLYNSIIQHIGKYILKNFEVDIFNKYNNVQTVFSFLCDKISNIHNIKVNNIILIFYIGT